MSGQTPGISISPPEAVGFPLTKEFLEIAFKKEVDTFTANLGTNPGDNYLSIIHAVDVKFKGEQGENHYLIKCYPNHPGRREFLDETNVFEKELFMYDDFLPQLKQLLRDQGVDDGMGLSQAPYHGGNVVGSNITTSFKDGPWSQENFIIMTDMRKTSGFRMVDRRTGLDLTHAKLALKEIAKMHATSWAYKQKNGLRLLTSKYDRFRDTMYEKKEMIDKFKPIMDSITESTVKQVGDVVGRDHPACINLHKFLTGDVMDLLRESVQAEGIDEEKQERYLRIKPEDDKDYVKDPWLVCAHGDCWVNNMLFRYDDQDPSHPVAVTLVDFQICREACPTTDLIYFLVASVRAPVRNPNEDELLKVYYDAFMECCKALQVEPLPGFTFKNLQRRYKRVKLFGLGVALPLLSVVLKPPEESVDMDKGTGEDVIELFASVMEGTDRNKVFKDEVAASVLRFYEEGVL